MLKRDKIVCVYLAAMSLSSCGSPEAEMQVEPTSAAARSTSAIVDAEPTGTENLNARLVRLNEAITRWRDAPSVRVAHEAAEEARNLVVGEAGPFYGDANRDGTVSGANAVGVLPGLEGEGGLAQPGKNSCIDADVMGGSWDNPAMRWSQLRTAIHNWKPNANTFPSLPSHPQRVVGWASLTLQSDTLASAREFAGHARIHVDVSLKALHDCRR